MDGVIPERGSVVKWFSRWFLASLCRKGTHDPRRSRGLRFERLRQGFFGNPFMARPRTYALIAHGLFSESGRSRSCPGDCTSTHPFVHPPALRPVPGRSSLDRPARTVFCDHPARPSSSQSHRRPSGITPDGSMRHLGLSQARRDRDQGHDRCNHYSVVSRLPGTYQRLTQGGSSPSRSHKSKAA